MVYLLQHAFALLVLAAFLVLPGLVLERSLVRGMRLGPLRPLARIVLGLGFWIACTFLLAAFGGLRPPVLWTVICLVVVSSLAVWRPSGRITRAALPRAATALWMAALGGLLAPLFLLALTPTVSWDAGAYHLTLPRLFLDHGGFREVPLNVYSYWPLNVQLLYSLALGTLDHVLAKLLHFAFGVATLFALVLGCRAFHRPASGPLAAIFLLANGVVAFELRVAYVDLAHAFFLLAGVLFMLQALEREPRALWLSGLCCGLAAGVKVTGIAGAAVVGALYLPRLAGALRRGDSAAVWRRLRLFLVRFAAPVFGLWAPWVARTWALTGNPVYPFLHRWLGGPDWSPALGARLQAWQSSIGMGREPLDYLLLPVRVILAGGRGYERFDGELGAFWIVLLPVALWAAWRCALVRRCLAVAGLYFAFWAATSQQMRFLVPALPILAIAAAVGLVELFDRLPAQRWRRGARGLAFAAAAAFLITGQGRMLAAGYRTLGVYLRAGGDLLATGRPDVWSFVEEELPADARLLLLNTNQGFHCRREYLADSFFEASQIAEWLAPAADVAEVRGLLQERGISHVLLDNRPRATVYPAALEQLLRDPDEAIPVYLWKGNRYSVFELGGRTVEP